MRDERAVPRQRSNIKTLNWDLHYWHNGADFYDLFGPVERSRKGDAFIVRLQQDR